MSSHKVMANSGGDKSGPVDVSRFACLSISYKTAPIELREKLRLLKSGRAELVARLQNRATIGEVILLDTCHRIELYVVRKGRTSPRRVLIGSLGKLTGQSPALVRKASRFFIGRQCIEHLFRLICGLDSMVPGEPQIAYQVKQAYREWARNLQVSSCLHTLFQKALKVNKKVRSSTDIDRGNISLASIAVELLKEKLGNVGGRRVAIFGAGKVAGLVARRLKMEGTRGILVSNRTYEKAVEIACELGGRAERFDHKEAVLTESEIVVASTSAPHCIIHRREMERVQHARGGRPMYMIDLSIPRDIEPEVAGVKGVRLFHLDDLEAVAQKNRRKRQTCIQEAEQLVVREVERFERVLLYRQVAPIIDGYYKKIEGIAAREFERALTRLRGSPRGAESILEEALHRLARKVAHSPTVNLKKMVAEEGKRPAEIFARLMGIKP